VKKYETKFRPPVAKPVTVTLGDDTLASLRALRDQSGLSLDEVLKSLLADRAVSEARSGKENAIGLRKCSFCDRHPQHSFRRGGFLICPLCLYDATTELNIQLDAQEALDAEFSPPPTPPVEVRTVYIDTAILKKVGRQKRKYTWTERGKASWEAAHRK
jgi:hypothetical protein